MKNSNIVIIRRPLAIACLIYIAIVWCYVLFTGYPSLNESQYAKKHILIEGYVEDKYVKDGKVIILIKKVKCSELVSNNGIKNIGAVCYLDEESLLTDPIPEIGSLVYIEGDGSAFRTASNPGEFDTKKYYASKGYYLALYSAKVVKKSTSYDRVREWLHEISDSIGDIYNNLFDDKAASVVRAMIIGDKNNLNQDVKQLFSDSGIAHLLSISGLHISIIGMGVVKLLELLRMPKKASIPATIIIMIGYYYLTGMNPSTFRALVMFSLMLFAGMIKRTYDLVTAMAMAAAYMVTANCYILLYAGFWLSFMAVFGIAVFAKCLFIQSSQIIVPSFISKKQKAWILNGINSIIACVAVSFFTLPVLLYYYYEYPVYSIFLNVLLVPVMGALLYCLIIIIILYKLKLMLLVKLLVYPCRAILFMYEQMCLLIGKLPGQHIIMGQPSSIKITFFYIMCFLMLVLHQLAGSETYEAKKDINMLVRILITKRLMINIAVIIISILVLFPIRPEFKLTMLDVGQGDGMVLQHGEQVYVFDGGSSSNDKLAQYQLVPALKSMGIGSIDYWFVSHPDSDHYSGLLDILQDEDTYGFNIKNIVLPNISGIGMDAKILIDAAADKGITVSGIRRGDVVNDGKLTIICLSPESDFDYGEDINSYSEVLLIKYGEIDILMTGDATTLSEEAYIKFAFENGIDIKNIDILKVPHHGSDSSSGQELIDAITPKISLISCGRNNRYGHPKEEIVDRLAKSKSQIIRTDQVGAILIETDGRRLFIKTYK